MAITAPQVTSLTASAATHHPSGICVVLLLPTSGPRFNWQQVHLIDVSWSRDHALAARKARSTQTWHFQLLSWEMRHSLIKRQLLETEGMSSIQWAHLNGATASHCL